MSLERGGLARLPFFLDVVVVVVCAIFPTIILQPPRVSVLGSRRRASHRFSPYVVAPPPAVFVDFITRRRRRLAGSGSRRARRPVRINLPRGNHVAIEKHCRKYQKLAQERFGRRSISTIAKFASPRLRRRGVTEFGGEGESDASLTLVTLPTSASRPNSFAPCCKEPMACCAAASPRLAGRRRVSWKKNALNPERCTNEFLQIFIRTCVQMAYYSRQQ